MKIPVSEKMRDFFAQKFKKKKGLQEKYRNIIIRINIDT